MKRARGEGWNTAPYVFIEAPVCPFCQSPKYARVRTEDGGDGSVMRKVICRNPSCGEKFKIVIALPETGNAPPADRYDSPHGENR